MDNSDSIDFIAKYKDWVAIKKLHIDDKVTVGEIVYHLASIRDATSNKSFDLVGIDKGILDSYADKITAGMRRSYQNLASAAQLMGSAEAKKAISDACKGNEKLDKIAETYLLRKVMSNLGMSTELDREKIVAAYPEAKIPKPPGRFGSKKKE